ncbi:MAG: sulfatase-like hydrolase/transferase [Victivallaceae bacterium]|nr:sulfatase-like hydrolase/transferase [Victivallaceae bacterium]
MNKNIVIIQTDAQPYSWLGITGDGQIETPNLDLLAEEGILFTESHSCSGVCVPSRAALMTGRYSIAHGVTNNFIDLPEAELQMGQIFSAAGYKTGYFGKTHFGWDDQNMPAGGWQEHFLWGEEYNNYLRANGISTVYPEGNEIKKQTKYWPFGQSNIPIAHYFENVIADKALDFIRHHKNEQFLLYLSNIAPHAPITPPGHYATMYNPDDIELLPRHEQELKDKSSGFTRWISQLQKYITSDDLRVFIALGYGLVSMVDANVGRLIKLLKAENIYDDTIVIFTSDHGDFASQYGVLGKSWSMSDALIRVPLIVSHPQYRHTGRKVDALVENIDVLPTIMEYAGIPIPGIIQGKPFSRLISGEVGELKDYIFAYDQGNELSRHDHSVMVKNSKWKLVYNSDDSMELYNLKADPLENINLIKDKRFKAIAAELERKVLHWFLEYSEGAYRKEAVDYWVDECCFYDEAKFNGTRQHKIITD